ncbi:hypothetical protein ASF23_17205 [Curtobacterium sp. Leaf261]|nr:hypothetical protein ASF23_17205 [Curtobacterium sp. Leaf261]
MSATDGATRDRSVPMETLTTRNVAAPAAEQDPMTQALGAFVLMHRANALVTASLAQQYGCGVSDMRALVFIAGGGDTTPSAIGRELGLSSGAITTLVDRLENADWAQRVPNPHDRRSSYLELRSGGRTVLEQITAVYAAAFTAATNDAAAPASFDCLMRAFTNVGTALRATIDRE